jgi:hypothetical protein
MGTPAVRSLSDVSLEALAARQHGLVTRRQAAEADISAGMIRRRLQTDRWQPLGGDVFMVTAGPVTWPTRVMAACLATNGIASHRTAALLHGLSGFDRQPIEVSVGRYSRGAHVDLPDVVVHRSCDIADAGMERRCEGIPVTGSARLVADLGGSSSRRTYEAAVDELVGRGALSWPAVFDSLLVHARRGRNGSAALRQLVEARRGTDLGDDLLDAAFVRLLTTRGLPPPVAGHLVKGRYRVDLAYPDQQVAIDLSGIHRDGAAGDGAVVQTRLTAAGWVVLAFAWRTLVERPGGIVSSVRALLDAPPVAEAESA